MIFTLPNQPTFTMAEGVAKIIFIYNAKSGKLNAALDSVHKMFSPSTYPCELCAITHGAIDAKSEWKAFLKRLSLPVEFYHKDEYSTNQELPVVLFQKEDQTMPFLTKEEMEGLSTAALIYLLETKLRALKVL